MEKAHSQARYVMTKMAAGVLGRAKARRSHAVKPRVKRKQRTPHTISPALREPLEDATPLEDDDQSSASPSPLIAQRERNGGKGGDGRSG